ncbi:MAG: ferrous iron transport protein B [Bacteroidaceae bacterium]|nr:ferrous iron transport protein B [Bacteroidaceae bacterium]
MRLSDLNTGETGVIVKVLGHGGFRKRIVEMGFIKGKSVTVVLNAPLKDPVKYRVMGYEVSLRRKEAEMIEIISEEEAQKEVQRDEELKGLPETYSLKEEDLKRLALGKRRTINVALVGNPNCGKTTLFNIASGAHERVGNYSGVTVDAKSGYFDFEGYHFHIVDLPGTYSLSAYSPEEMYVRQHIIEETPDIIINVIDSSNLERNLYLTTQLIDMNVRLVGALNMYDELESNGSNLDYHLLGKLLGVPMVPTNAKKNFGIEKLFHIVINVYEGADFIDKSGNLDPEVAQEIQEWHHANVDETHHTAHEDDYSQPRAPRDKVYRHIHINHGHDLEQAIDSVKAELAGNENIRYKYSTRYLSIKLLENDSDVLNIVRTFPNSDAIFEKKEAMQKIIKETFKEDCESALTDAKYAFISGALKETYKEGHKEEKTTTTEIDHFVTHRIWGYPIFFFLIYLMFAATFSLGQYPMNWIEDLVNLLGGYIRENMAAGPLKDMVVDGIIGGVGSVIVFLPNILILYFCISLMEDSGYMARAAFIMDKIMHKMGLHGKSFIPLIMGFGCNVPAVMASRTIEDRKSRLITMLITPLMSCSARLPIYFILIGAFFKSYRGLLLFVLYFAGIILSVIMAKLFSKYLIKGQSSPFVMELPPYRMPSAKSIFRHTWDKGKQYLHKMGGIILVASVIIWFLGYYPNHNQYNSVSQQQEHSFIGEIGKVVEPVMRPLGFDWKLDIGLVAGVGAKELVASTLGVLYVDKASDNVSLVGRIPITRRAAFSYLLFVLIYFPCVATISAIKQESGSWKYAWLVVGYTTTLAWIVSFLFYQIGGLFV